MQKIKTFQQMQKIKIILTDAENKDILSHRKVKIFLPKHGDLYNRHSKDVPNK